MRALTDPLARLRVTPLPGADFLRFIAESSIDPTDESRIKSQYERELLAGTPGFGALGLSGCDTLVSAASFGTVALPRSGTVSIRIDVVATVPHARGLGLARATVAHLLLGCLERHEASMEHASVVAVHAVIRRIVQSLGFVDSGMNTSFPVLQLTLDDAGRARLRAELARQSTLAHAKSECARCALRRRSPWCQRSAA